MTTLDDDDVTVNYIGDIMYTARHEVSPIKERTYCCSKKSGEEGSEWLTPPL